MSLDSATQILPMISEFESSWAEAVREAKVTLDNRSRMVVDPETFPSSGLGGSPRLKRSSTNFGRLSQINWRRGFLAS